MPLSKTTFESRIDYSLIFARFDKLLSIGVVAIYIAVSHDYPDNTWPMVGQQILPIGGGLLGQLLSSCFLTPSLKFTSMFLVLASCLAL